jgi:hypothetical protein
MKYSFFVIGAALFVASCKDGPKTLDTTSIESVDTNKLRVDTIGLAEYKAFKAQQLRDSIEKDSLDRAAALARNKETQRRSSGSTRNSYQNNSAVSSSERSDETYNSGNISSESNNTAEAPEKKGWSKTAKGAVIGGVVGAGTGAVINKKNRSKGAIIGGAVGAGAGAIIGRDQDKKDGRRQ